MDQHPNSIPPCHEFSTRFCQSASAGLQFYARAARCHGTLLRKGRRSLSDGGGVGLNLAMGSINLSGLEDSNVNGIVELPFYKEGHHFREIFF